MPNPIDFTLNVRLPLSPADGFQPTTSTGKSTLPSPVTEQWTRLPDKRSHDQTQAMFRAVPDSIKQVHRSKEKIATSIIAYREAVASRKLPALELAGLYDKGGPTFSKYVSRNGKLTLQGVQILDSLAGKKFQPITRVVLELWIEQGNTLSIAEFARLHGLYYQTFRRLVLSDHTLSIDGELWLKFKDRRDALVANEVAPKVVALAKSLEDEVLHIGAPALVADATGEDGPKLDETSMDAWARELFA